MCRSVNWLCLAVVLGSVFISGCWGRGANYTELSNAIEARARKASDIKLDDDRINGVYQIGPPDEIKVIVTDNADLSTETTVRPDGYITFPFSKLHDVYAEGLTPKQLAEKLTQELSKYILDVQVTVEVTNFRSQSVFVFGEVGREGAMAFNGDMSMLDAIGGARNITRRGKPRAILLVRGKPDNPEVFVVDMVKITQEGDSSQNIMLQENDVVHVPPNIFARVGYAIDNVLFPFRSILSAMYTAQLATSDRYD